MYQLPDSLQKEIVLALESDILLFPPGWVVRLYINNHTPTKSDAVAAFTELTNVLVPGYAPQTGGWMGTPARKQDGSWEDLGAAPMPFNGTLIPPAPQIVYGWFATDAAGAVLIGSGLFSVPFTYELAGDGFNLENVLNVLQVDGNDYRVELDMEVE